VAVGFNQQACELLKSVAIPPVIKLRRTAEQEEVALRVYIH
jgi:hypothetical protein